MERQEIIDGIWSLVDPSIDGYSKMIDTLMSAMTDEQLEKVLNDLER